jgi:predicted glycoside hydrolase/deacetylase ChbG (UPF0249 family)
MRLRCAQIPELAVGLHFTLTLGKPVGNTPSLTREGLLGKWIWDLAAQGSLPLEEIADELACQYARLSRCLASRRHTSTVIIMCI